MYCFNTLSITTLLKSDFKSVTYNTLFTCQEPSILLEGVAATLHSVSKSIFFGNVSALCFENSEKFDIFHSGWKQNQEFVYSQSWITASRINESNLMLSCRWKPFTACFLEAHKYFWKQCDTQNPKINFRHHFETEDDGFQNT